MRQLFPADAGEQHLQDALRAVFRSWVGPRNAAEAQINRAGVRLEKEMFRAALPVPLG